jgi:hypothetical protein
METLIKAQASQRDDRKLEMLEAKVSDAKSTANDPKLTPEEQNRRLREILK